MISRHLPTSKRRDFELLKRACFANNILEAELRAFMRDLACPSAKVMHSSNLEAETKLFSLDMQSQLNKILADVLDTYKGCKEVVTSIASFQELRLQRRVQQRQAKQETKKKGSSYSSKADGASAEAPLLDDYLFSGSELGLPPCQQHKAPLCILNLDDEKMKCRGFSDHVHQRLCLLGDSTEQLLVPLKCGHHYSCVFHAPVTVLQSRYIAGARGGKLTLAKWNEVALPNSFGQSYIWKSNLFAGKPFNRVRQLDAAIDCWMELERRGEYDFGRGQKVVLPPTLLTQIKNFDNGCGFVTYEAVFGVGNVGVCVLCSHHFGTGMPLRRRKENCGKWRMGVFFNCVSHGICSDCKQSSSHLSAQACSFSEEANMKVGWGGKDTWASW